jgi:DNA-directed RNA polymerase alpha subunit
MIEANDILTFMELENVRKKQDFIKRVTNNKTKQKIFNDRFFDGKSFTTSAHECGVSEAMAKHFYKSAIKDIESYMYLQEKIQEYKETGSNENISIEHLPLSNRIKKRMEFGFLHTLTIFTEQDFWRHRGCGQKSLDEIKNMMAKFGLSFKDPSKPWEKIYSLKK